MGKDKPREDDTKKYTLVTREHAIILERDLARYARLLDSLVRIPFTRKGVGADAAIGTVPVIGDVTGLFLTAYALYKARKLGVSLRQLWPAIRLSILDLFLGMVPVIGDVADILIQPSRRAVNIVREHVRETYDVEQTVHVDHPFLHQDLQKKQQTSAFWRNPVVAWTWLHIPDFLGTAFIILFGWAVISSSVWLWHLIS